MLPVKKTTTAWQPAVARRAANDHRTARAPFPVVVTTGSTGGSWWLWVCPRMVIRFRSMEEDAAAHEGSARGPEPLLAEAGDQLLPRGGGAGGAGGGGRGGGAQSRRGGG